MGLMHFCGSFPRNGLGLTEATTCTGCKVGDLLETDGYDNVQ